MGVGKGRGTGARLGLQALSSASAAGRPDPVDPSGVGPALSLGRGPQARKVRRGVGERVNGAAEGLAGASSATPGSLKENQHSVNMLL